MRAWSAPLSRPAAVSAASDAGAAADVPVEAEDGAGLRDGARHRAPPRARPGERRLHGVRQRKAGRAVALRQRSPSDHRGRHARHERQHDAQHRVPEAGRRTVRDPAAAGGQGAGRRVQRQDRDRRELHQRSRRADLLDQGAGLRQRHAPVGRRRREPRRARRRRRAQGGRRLHRRRRHREPDQLREGARPRPRRRGDDLRDRPRERLSAARHGARAHASRSRPAPAVGRNRRRLLRVQEDRGARPGLHARRAGAAQPVPARLHADAAGWQGAQARSEDDETGDDGAGPPQLRREPGERPRGRCDPGWSSVLPEERGDRRRYGLPRG